jgi:hypothetical protein
MNSIPEHVKQIQTQMDFYREHVFTEQPLPISNDFQQREPLSEIELTCAPLSESRTKVVHDTIKRLERERRHREELARLEKEATEREELRWQIRKQLEREQEEVERAKQEELEQEIEEKRQQEENDKTLHQDLERIENEKRQQKEREDRWLWEKQQLERLEAQVQQKYEEEKLEQERLNQIEMEKLENEQRKRAHSFQEYEKELNERMEESRKKNDIEYQLERQKQQKCATKRLSSALSQFVASKRRRASVLHYFTIWKWETECKIGLRNEIAASEKIKEEERLIAERILKEKELEEESKTFAKHEQDTLDMIARVKEELELKQIELERRLKIAEEAEERLKAAQQKEQEEKEAREREKEAAELKRVQDIIEQERKRVEDATAIVLEVENDLTTKGTEHHQAILKMKFMLLESRMQVSMIDSTFISELIAYKLPPEAVFKTIRAVLLIIGVADSELKRWDQCKKHLKTGFLQQLITYDPTSVQKEIRFMLAKEEVKNLDHDSCLKKGSLVTAIIFNYVQVALELRKVSQDLRYKVPSYQRTTFSFSKTENPARTTAGGKRVSLSGTLPTISRTNSANALPKVSRRASTNKMK